jgi:hypothetical protein
MPSAIGRGTRIHARCTPGHRHDEAIAAPADRLDEALARSFSIEEKPTSEQGGYPLDRRLGPDGGHDFFLRNDGASPLDQHREEVERARPDHNRREVAMLVAPEQPAAGALGAKLHKLKM